MYEYDRRFNPTNFLSHEIWEKSVRYPSLGWMQHSAYLSLLDAHEQMIRLQARARLEYGKHITALRHRAQQSD